MVVLDSCVPALTVITAIEGHDPTARPWPAATHGRGGRGFLGACRLNRQSTASDMPFRMIEILHWERAHEHLMPAPTGGSPEAVAYDLDTVVSADGRERAILHTSTGNGPITGVLFLDPLAGRREWLNDLNRYDTLDLIRHLPGFVSASFLLSRTSDRIAEFVQWRSTDDLHAAMADPRFQEHSRLVGEYAAVDFGLYDILGGAENHREE